MHIRELALNFQFVGLRGSNSNSSHLDKQQVSHLVGHLQFYKNEEERRKRRRAERVRKRKSTLTLPLNGKKSQCPQGHALQSHDPQQHTVCAPIILILWFWITNFMLQSTFLQGLLTSVRKGEPPPHLLPREKSQILGISVWASLV